MAINFGNLGKTGTYEQYSKKMLDNLNNIIVENDKSRIKQDNLEPLEYVTNHDHCMEIKICPEPITFVKDITGQITSQDKENEFRRKMLTFKTYTVKRPENNFWLNKTSNGINIRLGNVEGDTGYQTPAILGDDCVHGVVVGRTGSGKSVLLNNIILNLISEYSPWELDLFLVDMKKVELSRYMATNEDGDYLTPHISCCAATSEIKYVVSMIQYLSDCMKARQTLFAALGIQKIKDFRDKYGVVLPRVLLLVDEFQQLFLEAKNKEKRILDECITEITKLGRATGFHLLFASQEMSGALGAKELANFKLRIALPCDEAISTMILGNSAAAKVEKKGITLVNKKGGSPATDNIEYHTPFVNDNDENGKGSEFFNFLKKINNTYKQCDYIKTQKFYQEDVQENIYMIGKLRKSRSLSNQIDKIIADNEAIIDVLILGTGVLYTNLKHDFESLFLEKGKKRNIGIICANDNNIGNTLKMLAENFKNSNIKYEHTVVYESEVLRSVYSDLINDLDNGVNSVAYEKSFYDMMADRESENLLSKIITSRNYNDSSEQILKEIYKEYLRFLPESDKSYILSQLNGFPKAILDNYPLLCETLDEVFSEIEKTNNKINNLPEYSKAFVDTVLHVITKVNSSIKKNDDANERLKFKDKLQSLQCIPYIFHRFNCGSNTEQKYAHFIRRAEKYRNDNENNNSEPIRVRWIIGTDNLEMNDDKVVSKVMENCTNNNEIFVLAGSTPETMDRSFKCCNYIFLNSPDERIYTKFRMSYSGKVADSKVMDLKIINYNQEKSYKEFYHEFKMTTAPSLDFENYDI